MSKVVIVNGSPNRVSRLNGVIEYIVQQLEIKGFYAGTIHVNALPAEALIFGRFDNSHIQSANSLLASADAVIFASPVYKASYTGLLKTYLDMLPQNSLADKWICPVFIGGTIAHLLSVEYSFKPVASVLGARYFTPFVYAVDTQVTRIEENGTTKYALHEQLLTRLDQTIHELLKQLEGSMYV